MSVNVVLAALPFLYVRNWRYYQGFRVLSYILGVLTPMLIYAYLSSETFRFGDFALAWLMFWTLYEIGYLHNDCVAVKKEQKPTDRAPPEVREHFAAIVAFRCGLFLFGLLLAAVYTHLNITRLLTITGLTATVFLVHNTLTEYRDRFVTLVLLSVLHPSFVIYALGLEVAPYVFLLVPYLALKYVDYLFNKGMATVNLREDPRTRWMLFTAWAAPVALLGPKLLLVFAPIYISHAKHYYWERLIATRWGGALAKKLPMHALFDRPVSSIVSGSAEPR